MVVPSPGGLDTEISPPSTASRSPSPRRPPPRLQSAPPTPSSTTCSTTRASSWRITTLACDAPECLTTFASASEAT
jgi:hypothetical protein